MMTGRDFTALAPLIALALTPVAIMLAIMIRRSHRAVVIVTIAGLAASLATLGVAAGVVPRQVTPLLVIDGYSLFYTGLILAGTLAVVLLGYGYLDPQATGREEFYILLTAAALGSAVLASSSHFASFFLGLEILSVPLYALIAYLPMRKLPVEAGLKYLVLAAASAAFLLFGMALVYAALGTMSFGEIARRLELTGQSYALLVPGTVLILTGIGFKLAVVPFHLWTPDVYEGAPAPVTAFIATVSKGGVVALLLRYFYSSHSQYLGPVMIVIAIVAIASMVAGNILALLQNNVKRILAYSSIAHLGYILVAFLAGGANGAAAATFYVAAYFITTLGAFGCVTVLSTRERDADRLDDYRGLFWRRPGLAAVFTAMLLSLAGLPLTAGFIGKFYIVAAGAGAGIWALIIILVVTSAIGLYYYLRVIFAMYDRREPEAPEFARAPAAAEVALAVLAVLLVWLGIFPGPLVNLIRTAVATLI
jgi:NADH-quinone oxidoreductase subunit N